MKNIYDYLEQFNIQYKRYDHPPLHTMDDASKFYELHNVSWVWENKNLFLRNDKKDKYILVTMFGYKRLDIKKIAEIFGEKRLSFASDEDLFRFLKIYPWSVSPFALINDLDNLVEFVLDKSIFDYQRTLFHPLDNTVSLEIDVEDLNNFLNSIWKKINILDI